MKIMKIWKIEHTNKSTEGVKIAIGISSNESRGIILKAGEFVLAQEQPTASLDSQTRRGYVRVEEFDNSSLHLNLGEAYNANVLIKKEEPIITEAVIETTEPEGTVLTKLQEAEKDASSYIDNKK